MKLVEYNGKMGIWVRRKGGFAYFIPEEKIDKSKLKSYEQYDKEMKKSQKQLAQYFKKYKKEIDKEQDDLNKGGFIIGDRLVEAHAIRKEVNYNKKKRDATRQNIILDYNYEETRKRQTEWLNEYLKNKK